MVMAPNPLALCRNKTPRSALGDGTGVQGRQTPMCSPCTPAGQQPAGSSRAAPLRGGHARLSPLPTSGSVCWQAAWAAFQDPLSPWPLSPAPQDTARQTVTCQPLCGLVSYDPTQGACEKEQPRPSFPLFLLSLFHFVWARAVGFEPSRSLLRLSPAGPSGTVRKREAGDSRHLPGSECCTRCDPGRILGWARGELVETHRCFGCLLGKKEPGFFNA